MTWGSLIAAVFTGTEIAIVITQARETLVSVLKQAILGAARLGELGAARLADHIGQII